MSITDNGVDWVSLNHSTPGNYEYASEMEILRYGRNSVENAGTNGMNTF